VKTTKYISSGGLAFSEEKDMNKLEEYAKKGWILENFAFLGYRLRKSDCQDITYSLDYQDDIDDDYFAYFEEAGWTHSCSAGNSMHIFHAPIGTKPIYSDNTTIVEKYEGAKNQSGKVALPCIVILLFLWLIDVISESGLLHEWVGQVSFILAVPIFIVTVFSGLPYISYQFKLRKLRKQ
jgi:hypothetical protein